MENEIDLYETVDPSELVWDAIAARSGITTGELVYCLRGRCRKNDVYSALSELLRERRVFFVRLADRDYDFKNPKTSLAWSAAL